MLSKHAMTESDGSTRAHRWYFRGAPLAHHTSLGDWLSTDLPLDRWAKGNLESSQASSPVGDTLQDELAPVDDDTEVWAAGVTYLRSREARMEESDTADIYDKVYDADRAEIFFKAVGWRIAGSGQPIRIRRDSKWNVPEPEVTLVINAAGQIVGYTAGNDVSSRDIEGANPLYLPQAKVYDGSCAIGPRIVPISTPEELANIPLSVRIHRGGKSVFAAETSTAKMKRNMTELAAWLYRELSFPRGSMLMTGTGIVPPDAFTLEIGDRVAIQVGDLSLTNEVRS